MKTLTKLLPFLLVAALGCSHAEKRASSGATAGDYYPLAIGNRWLYQATGGGPQRSVEIVEEEEGFFIDNAKGRLKVDAEGLRDGDRYLLKNPIAPGTRWSAILSPSSIERYEIVEVARSITTPAGHFDSCVVVKSVNRVEKELQMELEWIYAPGVGIVRMSASMRDGQKEIPQGGFELKRFTPGAKKSAP